MTQVPLTLAAVRGAVQVHENRAEAVREATARLLAALVDRNALRPESIVSAIFTATPDLDADFPAHAARLLGWTDVPLLGAMEMAVPGALPRVVRVLLTVQGVPAGRRLVPVYLGGAAALRPDLSEGANPGMAGAAERAEPGGRDTRTIAILGLGQVGGSIGLGLGTKPGWRRAGFDLDPAVSARALAAGAIDRRAESVEDACRDADLAVVAVPVDEIPGVLAAAAAALPPGAALTDTGSARAGSSAAVARARTLGVHAIGGHPLAGNEGRGFESARADLFAGERWVLCPEDRAAAGTGEDRRSREELAPAPAPRAALAMIEALGARVVFASPEAHDAALARTSHLPYLLARALRAAGGPADRAGLAGPAFRGMTRVAASDPRVAESYCRQNLAEIRAAWESVRAEVEHLIADLSRGRAATGS